MRSFRFQQEGSNLAARHPQREDGNGTDILLLQQRGRARIDALIGLEVIREQGFSGQDQGHRFDHFGGEPRAGGQHVAHLDRCTSPLKR